ncbi:hypothetical protein ACR777_15040 [Sphingobacterium spiritivorum]|uniref:hypothetical protein n=1 Tax=Sphingobacterium spiritivorum TaxID=258 RepID=UPI003DA68B95
MANKTEKARLSLLSKIKAVNDLVALGLMQEFTPDSNVYIFKELLEKKDRSYVLNWCKNVLNVWILTYMPGKENTDHVELKIFDKDTGDFLCRYSKKTGIHF